MIPTQSLLLIKDAAAPKAGAYANGAVRYRLLTDSDRSDLYFAITGNQGGSGYFSREVVPFTKVRRCVADVQPGAPLPSKTFKPAFVGRSTNNPGFLAAILRAEGLLSPAPDTAHQHVISGDWAAWLESQLALPAEPLPEPASDSAGSDSKSVVQAITGADDAAAADRLPSKKGRKEQAHKRQHPTAMAVGEGGHAAAL
ncbi:hypothetical protein [Caldimonas tepidiphila]|uniref:hypothetical protein n=1 Tax=Caldimonas tepidiphila TaxID=2315841 RepID=UPI000E5A2BAF|nr:hypothetical protein [Caldimonas tepidiphila]